MNYYVYAECPQRKRKSRRGGMHAAVVNKFNEIATVFICNVWHRKYMAFFVIY